MELSEEAFRRHPSNEASASRHLVARTSRAVPILLSESKRRHWHLLRSRHLLHYCLSCSVYELLLALLPIRVHWRHGRAYPLGTERHA